MLNKFTTQLHVIMHLLFNIQVTNLLNTENYRANFFTAVKRIQLLVLIYLFLLYNFSNVKPKVYFNFDI